MNTRDAILAAASHIEQNPDQHSFGCPVSEGGGMPAVGCALVWVGYFAGQRMKSGIIWANDVEENLLKINRDEGVMRLYGIAKDWHFDADRCAAALRKYADLYHPPEKEERKVTQETTTWNLCVWQPKVAA